jgi:hypothetical protein
MSLFRVRKPISLNMSTALKRRPVPLGWSATLENELDLGKEPFEFLIPKRLLARLRATSQSRERLSLQPHHTRTTINHYGDFIKLNVKE